MAESDSEEKRSDVVALDDEMGLASLSFDIWRVVEEVGAKGTLEHVAMRLFGESGLLTSVKREGIWCQRDTFLRWVRAVELGYLDRPYHTSVHAADVMCTANAFLVHSGLLPPVSNAGGTDEGVLSLAGGSDWRLARFSLLVASAVHDVGHLGFTNPFLKTTRHPLSLEYPDVVGINEVELCACLERSIFSTRPAF